MIRILLATIVGAVVLYIWNMAAWMFLPVHEGTIHNLTDEQAIKQELVKQNLKPGYYVVPGMPEKQTEEAFAACMKAHREGPVVSIIYANGAEMMSPQVMAGGFGIDVAACLIAALLLSGATCCKYYLQRVGFVMGMGLFAFLVSYLALLNWMYYPLDYTLGMFTDMVIGWTLAGLVMGLFIKPKSPIQQQQQSSTHQTQQPYTQPGSDKVMATN